jgi:hypothetical protein
MACVGRRILAKLVDVALFGAMSLVIGRLLVPDQVSLGGLVPAFGTTVWTLGFFVAADTICARLLGATPGELLAGVRVCMADGSRLTWSARQDRTTDALVDGTIGVTGLLGALLRGQPAPYDKDVRVEFVPIGGAQRLVVAALTVACLGLLLIAGLWLTVIRAIDADTHVAASKLLRHAGVPVRAVWANPVSGLPVVLPDGWYVAREEQRTHVGDTVVEFRCATEEGECSILLGVSTWQEAGYLAAETDTTREAIENAFNGVLDESDATVIDERSGITGAARLDQIYMAELPAHPSDPGGTARYGLAWFSERKNAWLLTITVPQREPGALLSDEERAFALELLQSAFGAKGH